MGLLKASNNFDFIKSKNFTNYASKYIIFEMKKELKNKNLIRVSDYFDRIRTKINKFQTNDLTKLSELTNVSLENIVLAKEQYVILDDEQIFQQSNYDDRNFLLYLTDEELELYSLRIKHNLNQKEISEYLNISQSTVSRKLKELKDKITQLR